MIDPHDSPVESPIERWREIAGRVAMAAISVAFAAGLVFWFGGRPEIARDVLSTGCVLLVATPIVNVLAVLGEEVRRRDWPFACAAALVLVLLAIAVASRLT
jgi:uncharacterized membrane protein